jgi:hypothetical protein
MPATPQDAIEQGVFLVDGPRGTRGGAQDAEVDMDLVVMTLSEVGGRGREGRGGEGCELRGESTAGDAAQESRCCAWPATRGGAGRGGAGWTRAAVDAGTMDGPWCGQGLGGLAGMVGRG